MNESLERPPMLLQSGAPALDPDAQPDAAASRLVAGETLLLRHSYAQGVKIMASLRRRCTPSERSFEARVRSERTVEAHAQRLLVRVIGHRVQLKGAQDSGFIRELYPSTPDFFISLSWLQALHGAWERYRQGVSFPVLGHRLHPYYGVYAPTRMTHLELFATWLSTHEPLDGLAMDVGTGCGVVALMLRRRGFKQVIATDINPNAIESVQREKDRLKIEDGLQLRRGDLLCGAGSGADLIVFNPPWTQGDPRSAIDRALVYEDGLFRRFFDQCGEALSAAGRVVVIFSNIIRLVQPGVEHPIEAELARGRFLLDQRLHRRVRAEEGRRTQERVEVWVLRRL